jgi:hypothetical protein
MTDCKICGKPADLRRLDFGPQALTNRFLRSPDEAEYEHPLSAGVCPHCGTVQLGGCVPVAEMRPRFDWIFYNEPESHLDDAAEVIRRLPGLTPASTIAGLTYKDESTLKRLNRLGLPKTWQADLRQDLGVTEPTGGIESIQERLTVPAARRLAAKYGQPDVLLLRHVLEHSYDIHEVLHCLKELVAPGGYIVFEMPDARRALERLDYSTVWEEHIFYFTPVTLRHCLENAGLEVVFLESYFYTLENSLVAIARVAEDAGATGPVLGLREEIARAERFFGEFSRVRAQNQELLNRIRREEGKIAFLGAGHLSAAYICLYGLQGLVDLVVDDNPKKQGLFMPGSKLPILESSALVERDVKVCLMGVRPEIEDAVVQKNKAFTDRGGRMASIFPDSRYSLYAGRGESLKKAG